MMGMQYKLKKYGWIVYQKLLWLRCWQDNFKFWNSHLTNILNTIFPTMLQPLYNTTSELKNKICIN